MCVVLLDGCVPLCSWPVLMVEVIFRQGMLEISIIADVWLPWLLFFVAACLFVRALPDDLLVDTDNTPKIMLMLFVFSSQLRYEERSEH